MADGDDHDTDAIAIGSLTMLTLSSPVRVLSPALCTFHA